MGPMRQEITGINALFLFANEPAICLALNI